MVLDFGTLDMLIKSIKETSNGALFLSSDMAGDDSVPQVLNDIANTVENMTPVVMPIQPTLEVLVKTLFDNINTSAVIPVKAPNTLRLEKVRLHELDKGRWAEYSEKSPNSSPK